jgi:Ca2+-binding RTX toxin-like protein
MATIELKNTANNPSTFYLGVNDAQNAPIGYENLSSSTAISNALLSFVSAFQSNYEAVARTTNWQNGSGWAVTEFIEVPAGAKPMTLVRFEKQLNGQNYEFSLVGTVSIDNANKNLFTISGSTLIVDSPYGDIEVKLSAATTMKFEQTNPSKTYETQTSFYSGNINQEATSVGALPIGAQLKSINANNLLPTSWTQLGADTNSFALMTLQGTFAFNPSNSSLGGTVTGMKTVNPVDDGPGFQLNTYAIANGKLNTTSAPKLGLFESNATLELTTQQRSEGPAQINFDTLIPDLPPSGVSTATYKSAPVRMSTEIRNAGAEAFSGNDTFTVTSNTDTFIHAGAGNDLVNAGAGNDIIYGGAGNDILNGGAGNDLFLVNQPDGGGNTIKHEANTSKTIFSHTLGNNVINGGAGLDTLSFSQEISSSPSSLKTKYVASNGPNVFSLIQNGDQYLVSIPGLPNSQYYVQNTLVNKYSVAAIELTSNAATNSKEIYVVDLETAEVFYHFTLGPGENLVRHGNNTSTTFFTETRSGNSLTLKSYDFSLNPTDQVTTQNYDFTNVEKLTGWENSWVSDLLVSANGDKYISISQSGGAAIYKLDASTNSTSLVTKFDRPDAGSGEWIDNTFFDKDGKTLWLKLGDNYSDNYWTEEFFNYNLSTGKQTQIYDRDLFWDKSQELAYQEPLLRIGETAVDLSQFGTSTTYVEVRGNVDISDDLHLLQLSISPNASSGIDYERWVVLDNNGTIVADKSFSSPTGYNVRTLGDNEVHNGYLYFWQANATFGSSSITQTGMPSIYKVALSDIPLVLATAGNTLDSHPKVLTTPNPNINKSYFATNPALENLLIYEAFIPVSDITGQNSTSNIVISRAFAFNPNDSNSTVKLTQFSASGEYEYGYSFGRKDDAGLKDYAINDGKIYLLISDHSNGSYSESTIVYDPTVLDVNNRIQVYQNSSREFRLAEQASQTAPEAEIASISAPGDLNPELSLILPAAYYSNYGPYGASSTLGGTDYYKDPKTGMLGERDDGYGNAQEWTMWQAPADGSIAIGYKNSFTDATEYSHLRDVEFLELNGPTGLETYDIRPLYLASSGNDTLYTFSRTGYESLNYIFDKASETSGYGAFDDPMSWYRNQFAVFTPRDGEQEWRYYLNAGAGNDTLYGRESTNETTIASKLSFNDWSFVGSGNLTLSKMVNGVSVTHNISFNKYSSSSSWATFNDEIVAQINQLNLGISAQRGTDTREVLISGLALAGWTVTLPPEVVGASLNNNYSIQDLGRDTLDGGAGADTMRGYGGNDSYFVDDAKDVVIESASSSQGFDTVLTSTTYALDGGTGVERLMVHQIMPGANGNLFTEPRATPPALASATVNLTGNNFTYELIGHDGANTITAGALAGLTKSSEYNPTIGAVLLGLGGTDTLIGGERDDHLFGGAGDDKLTGNAGNDSFYMGFLSADQSIANVLLPDEYYLWDNYGFDVSTLTGGNDTAIGGDGFDTVVIATDTNGDASPFYIQRISETQLKIFTIAETMVIDSSVEAIKYLPTGSASPQIYLLPWASTLNATLRDDNFIGSGPIQPWAWVAPSDFSDVIDLNAYPSFTDGVMSSFDGGKGDDIIYGDDTSRFSTLRGGDGNDWIFSGAYSYTNDSWRYEMYGDAGNDTLTLSARHLENIDPASTPSALLDGGAGDDNYRVIINQPDINIRIEDSAGKDTLTLYALNHDVFDIDVLWDGNELRVISYTDDGNSTRRNIVLAANTDTLENLFFVPYANEQSWYSTTAVGGNLVKPTADSYSKGKMTGTAGNDVLLALPNIRQDYDGGKGNDVILVGNVSGNIISGGEGNNIINQSTYVDYISTGPIRNTISYAWTAAGAFGEIDLQTGLGYVSDKAGALLGSDRWDAGLFTDVIGGAADERIKGSEYGNKLDGGAGNDIIYSGGNTAGYEPDRLIGGAGNDILIDESHWFSQWHWSQLTSNEIYELQTTPGSVMEGGAGNDVYVLQHNGTIPSTLAISNAPQVGPTPVTPTRIIERDAAGKDTGGSDTIRFVTSGEGLKSYKFAQKGNVVQIQLDTESIEVGDTLMVSFLSGNTASNGYTVEKVTIGTGSDAGTSIVEFTAATSATLSGNVLVDRSSGGSGPVVDWVDSNTLAVFGSGDISHSVLNEVSNGAPTITHFDSASGQVISNMPIQALIDKNAMEFYDFGSANPEQAGFVVPVSYNVGKSSSIELIISGGPGPATLFGGEGTDIIIDTPYDDILIGGNGNDEISSQIGFDIVDAGAGNDSIGFRSDGQILIGGQGADQFVIAGISNTDGALIADFKPWEGDELKLDDEWLQEFMSGESRASDVSYTDISFRYFSGPSNSKEFVIEAEFTYVSGFDNATQQDIYMRDSIDILRIQYNSDRDRAWDQIQLTMSQLESSALEAVPENQWDNHWTVNYQS